MSAGIKDERSAREIYIYTVIVCVPRLDQKLLSSSYIRGNINKNFILNMNSSLSVFYNRRQIIKKVQPQSFIYFPECGVNITFPDLSLIEVV